MSFKNAAFYTNDLLYTLESFFLKNFDNCNLVIIVMNLVILVAEYP